MYMQKNIIVPIYELGYMKVSVKSVCCCLRMYVLKHCVKHFVLFLYACNHVYMCIGLCKFVWVLVCEGVSGCGNCVGALVHSCLHFV